MFRHMSPLYPTVYPELNAVLEELVTSVRTILAENFCGAYLQGSFAVGDADVHSDVDFIVVTEDEVSAEQLAGLQEMHKRLHPTRGGGCTSRPTQKPSSAPWRLSTTR